MPGAPIGAGRIDADELPGVARSWDAAVDRTEGADPFCASTAWSFPAAASFPEAEPPVVLTDGSSFAGLRRRDAEDGSRLLVGLDPVWGFATPVVGYPMIAAHLLADRLAMEDHDLAVVAGQRLDSLPLACLVRVLGDRHRLLQGPTEHRLQVDLRDGFDGWWGRRSSRFRQQLRRLRARAEDAGVEVLDCSAMPPDEAMDRILAVEAGTWKAGEGTGLTSPDLADFYRRMAWRLAATEQLRLLVARRDGRDVGYVLGGVRGRTYRGLQLSSVEEARHLGIGHLLQLHQLEALPGTGIDTYDMGMDMPYKRRWADRVDETFSLVIIGG